MCSCQWMTRIPEAGERTAALWEAIENERTDKAQRPGPALAWRRAIGAVVLRAAVGGISAADWSRHQNHDPAGKNQHVRPVRCRYAQLRSARAAYRMQHPMLSEFDIVIPFDGLAQMSVDNDCTDRYGSDRSVHFSEPR